MEIKVSHKLKESLLMMKKRNEQNIAVTDLCKKADVARATFYLHYKDIDDFIRQTTDEIAFKFFEQIVVIIQNEKRDLCNALTESDLLLNKTDRELLGYLLSIDDLIFLMNDSDTSVHSKIERLLAQDSVQSYHKNHHLEWNYFISGLIAVLYKNLIQYSEAKARYEIYYSKDIGNAIFSGFSDEDND